MIKDQIGQHNVLLLINHNYTKICDISGIFASVEKQAINASMSCTNCPISAEIRTDDSQSDLRILL